MTIILDGKRVASEIRKDIKRKAEDFEIKNGKKPSLCIIQGGNRPDSSQYVRNKVRACKDNNINVDLINIPEDTENYFMELERATIVASLDYDGVIVQVPVPGITAEQQHKLINTIFWEKDVDGMTKAIESEFYTDNNSHSRTAPCTPMGIMEILKFYNIRLDGRKVVVIGRSNIVGRPLAHLMMTANATVTVCHSKTPLDDIYDYVKNADIVVCAIGKAEFINKWDFQGIDWSDKILIDVGTNRVDDKWFGDIAQEIKEKSYAYTPVPGGVGPMTITSLLSKIVNKMN